MKKILAVLMICFVIMSSIHVSAVHYEWTEDIDYGVKKVITIPQPEGRPSSNWVYLTQYFIFTPEVDGIYRFIIDYEEDESDPYDIYMDVSAIKMVDGQKHYVSDEGYWEIENGCQFNGRAGHTYELMFQYMTYDGRHPEFTFWVESNDVPNFEWTDDIAFGEKKVITIPQPDRLVNENLVYLTQHFIFEPKEAGTYRFMIDHKEGQFDPENIYMAVSAYKMVDGEKQYVTDEGYLDIENGCEFDGRVGYTYELMFQYMTYDGRHPEFTFWVESDDVENPKTGDTALLLPTCTMLLSATLAAYLFLNRKKIQ